MDLKKLRAYFVKVTKSAENMSNNNGGFNDLKLIKSFVSNFPSFINNLYKEPNSQLALLTMPEYNHLISSLNSLIHNVRLVSNHVNIFKNVASKHANFLYYFLHNTNSISQDDCKKISNYSESTLNCFKFTESDIIGSITIALMSHYKDCNFQYVYLYRTNKEIKKYGFPDDYYNKNHLALSVFQILKNIFVTNPLLITNYSVVKDAIATFNGKDSDALLRKLIQEIPALSKLNDIAFDPEKINYINFNNSMVIAHFQILSNLTIHSLETSKDSQIISNYFTEFDNKVSNDLIKNGYELLSNPNWRDLMLNLSSNLNSMSVYFLKSNIELATKVVNSFKEMNLSTSDKSFDMTVSTILNYCNFKDKATVCNLFNSLLSVDKHLQSSECYKSFENFFIHNLNHDGLSSAQKQSVISTALYLYRFSPNDLKTDKLINHVIDSKKDGIFSNSLISSLYAEDLIKNRIQSPSQKPEKVISFDKEDAIFNYLSLMCQRIISGTPLEGDIKILKDYSEYFETLLDDIMKSDSKMKLLIYDNNFIHLISSFSYLSTDGNSYPDYAQKYINIFQKFFDISRQYITELSKTPITFNNYLITKFNLGVFSKDNLSLWQDATQYLKAPENFVSFNCFVNTYLLSDNLAQISCNPDFADVVCKYLSLGYKNDKNCFINNDGLSVILQLYKHQRFSPETQSRISDLMQNDINVSQVDYPDMSVFSKYINSFSPMDSATFENFVDSLGKIRLLIGNIPIQYINYLIVQFSNPENLINNAQYSGLQKRVMEDLARYTLRTNKINSYIVIAGHYPALQGDSYLGLCTEGDKIIYLNENIISSNSCAKALNTVFHECHHAVQFKDFESGSVFSYNEYLMQKDLILSEFNSKYYSSNYWNVFCEIDAREVGARKTVAYCRELNLVPSTIEKSNPKFASDLLKMQNDSKSESMHYNSAEKKIHEGSYLNLNLIFDPIIQRHPELLKEHPILNLEYREDGSRKSLSEILDNYHSEYQDIYKNIFKRASMFYAESEISEFLKKIKSRPSKPSENSLYNKKNSEFEPLL